MSTKNNNDDKQTKYRKESQSKQGKIIFECLIPAQRVRSLLDSEKQDKDSKSEPDTTQKSPNPDKKENS